MPKAATLSHRNILNNGLFIGEALRYTEADRVCIPVPLFHCFGSVLGVMAAVTKGAACVLPGECFDAEAALAAVAAERCTSLLGVPTMFISMLELPRSVPNLPGPSGEAALRGEVGGVFLALAA